MQVQYKCRQATNYWRGIPATFPLNQTTFPPTRLFPPPTQGTHPCPQKLTQTLGFPFISLPDIKKARQFAKQHNCTVLMIQRRYIPTYSFYMPVLTYTIHIDRHRKLRQWQSSQIDPLSIHILDNRINLDLGYLPSICFWVPTACRSQSHQPHLPLRRLTILTCSLNTRSLRFDTDLECCSTSRLQTGIQYIDQDVCMVKEWSGQ